MESKLIKDRRDFEAGLVLIDTLDLFSRNSAISRRELPNGGYSLSYENPSRQDPNDSEEMPEFIELTVTPIDATKGKEFDSRLVRVNTSAEETADHRYMRKTDEICWRLDTQVSFRIDSFCLKS